MDTHKMIPENVRNIEIYNKRAFILKMLEKVNQPDSNSKLSEKANKDD